MELSLMDNDTTSPFDAVRKVRDDGTEYWSARDLMPLLGYPRWNEMKPAIERAKLTAANQGHSVDDLFRVNPEKSGGRPREDYHLTRYAAYLVAMNGDPRKNEVAAAQSYFAVRTREAETSTTAQLTGPALMAAALIEANRTLEEQGRQLEEWKPKVDVFDELLTSEGSYSVDEAAKLLTRAGIPTGQRRLFSTLDDLGWTSKPIGRGRRAYQRAIEYGHLVLKPTTYKHPRSGESMVGAPQIRVTSKGLYKLRDLMVQS